MKFKSGVVLNFTFYKERCLEMKGPVHFAEMWRSSLFKQLILCYLLSVVLVTTTASENLKILINEKHILGWQKI